MFDENTGTGSFDVTFSDGLSTSTVSVQVKDSYDAVSNLASIEVDVANVAPTADVSGPTDGFQGVRGQTRTFVLSATDPAAPDEAAGFTFSVDWGDGSAPDVFSGPSGTQAGHAFSAAGSYTILVTATDKDGGVSDPVTQSIAINVSEVQGTRLAVGGTGNDDQLAITPSGTNVTLTLNGSSLGTVTLPADGLQFFAGAGNDQLALNGTSTADLFTSGQGWVSRGAVRASGESVETYQVNGLGDSDTLTVVAGDVGFDGGAGADRLVGADAENQWLISGTNAGNLNGRAFASVEQLTGGTEADVFAFAGTGSISGQIDGGSGANQFDYSARSSSASINLASFTATGTGGFSNIQAFVGSPAASDTLTGPNTTNSWQLAGAGEGTLNGSYTFDGFENLTGGSQPDSFQFLFSAAGPGFGTVNGGSGSDVLDYSGVISPVFVNLLSRTASGLTVYSNIESFIGGSADDDLFGLNAATTWTINGLDSGTAGTIPFGSFENLRGGSGNDTFTLVDATCCRDWIVARRRRYGYACRPGSGQQLDHRELRWWNAQCQRLREHRELDGRNGSGRLRVRRHRFGQWADRRRQWG